MRALLAALLALGVLAAAPRPDPTGQPWTDNQAASLSANLDVLLQGASVLQSAHAGIVVADVRDGRVLYQRDADHAFQGASTTKLIVGSASLALLGPEHRFTTVAAVRTVPASGAGAAVHQLVVYGGNDPQLDDGDLASLARAVAAQTHELGGGIVFDESRTPWAERHPPGWSFDDALEPYAPVVNALPVDENAFPLTVTGGAAAGAPATLALAPPLQIGRTFVSAVRTVASGGGGDLDVHADQAGEVVVTGTIDAAKTATVRVAVSTPELLAADALRADLIADGVAVGAPPPADLPYGGLIVDGDGYDAPPAAGAIVWRRDGEPLSDYLARMWYPSDNLMAEELLRELGATAGPPSAAAPATAARGIAAEQGWLRTVGVDPATLTLADGSGLSQYDRVTPRALETILLADWNGPHRDVVVDDLPLAGVRGTIAGSWPGTAAVGHVWAKDGAMSHVRGLAGFVQTRTHGTVVFAFLVDEYLGDPAALDALRGRVLSELANA